MWWYVKQTVIFLMGIPECLWYGLTYRWCQDSLSDGFLQDIITFQVMNWVMFRVAWVAHRHEEERGKL
jgi:hypothetical protein